MKRIITCLTLFLLTTGICLAKTPNRTKQHKSKSKVDATINTNRCGYITSVCTSTMCVTIQPPPSESCTSPYPPLQEVDSMPDGNRG